MQTAKQTADWARKTIRSLAKHPEFGTLHSVASAVSTLSGLSLTTVQKFYQGKAENVTVNTLDSIVSAVRKLNIKQAS